MSGPTLEKIVETDALPVRNSQQNDQQWLTQLNAESPWLDHLTHDVFPLETSGQEINIQNLSFQNYLNNPLYL